MPLMTWHEHKRFEQELRENLVISHLAQTRGCVSEAAKALKMHPTQLHHFIRERGLRNAVKLAKAGTAP